MRFQASVLSSLCLFLFPTPPPNDKSHHCRGPEVSGTECSLAPGQPQLQLGCGPQIPGGWRSKKEQHGTWVAGRCQGLWLEGRMGGTSAKWLDACPLQRRLAWVPPPHFGSVWTDIPASGTPSSQRRPFPISPPAIFLVPSLSQG